MQVSDVLYCFLILSGYIGTCCVYPIKVLAILYYELCLSVPDPFAVCKFFSEFSHSDRAVQSNWTFGQGLGFKGASSMFGKFLVHAWR